MTPTRPTAAPDDWDDARVANAFVARADAVPAPSPDLAVVVMDRLARQTRPVTWSVRRLAPALAAAAAVIVAVVLGAGQLLTTGPSGSTSPSLATGPHETGSAGQPAPSPAVALPQVSIQDALAVRAAGDDRELAVAGFLSPLPTLPCPFVPAGENPTLLHCPQTFQWLMAGPEIVMTVGPGSVDGGPPKGPAFHPSFALVDPPDVPIPQDGGVAALPVVLVGHFHDRRAALCRADPAPETACGDVFVVDRVATVNGVPQAVSTRLRNQRFDDATQRQVTEQPRDLEQDVDRLALDAVHGGTILSRQLLTIDQVIGVEPILAEDEFIPYVGNPATLVWIVTTLDDQGDMPQARTFALIDGSNWFGEVTLTGMAMIERSGSAPPPTRSGPPLPSADPSAFLTAPSSVLGIEVRDVATAMRDRRADANDLGRDEFAIRAWYVGPDPAVTCAEPVPAIDPPTPPCDEARHWLLDDPAQLGTEVGQVRRLPEHWPRALNPLVPVDVPFDVPASWTGGAPVPQPVVVLGHFLDNRVAVYAGNVYFVVDALAWTRDRGAEPLDTVTRLTSAATEDPAGVLARVGDVSPNAAVATWATVVDAADFGSLDPGMAADAPEFTAGRPVWIVRRLIRNEMDGRDRLAIEWAYTADGGRRVWITETPDSHPDLATTIDIGPFGEHTRRVRVYDYAGWVVSVRRATAADGLRWQFTDQAQDGRTRLEIARGATDREIGIRWTGGACALDWRVLVTVHPGSADPGPWIQVQTFGEFCNDPGDTATRALVITFDRPVDLDRVRAVDDRCCG